MPQLDIYTYILNSSQLFTMFIILFIFYVFVLNSFWALKTFFFNFFLLRNKSSFFSSFLDYQKRVSFIFLKKNLKKSLVLKKIYSFYF